MRSSLVGAAVFLATLWLLPTKSAGSPVYSRRTNKDCTYCHPPTNYNLTDAGKYYQEHKTLNGYQEPKKDVPKKTDTTGTARRASH